MVNKLEENFHFDCQSYRNVTRDNICYVQSCHLSIAQHKSLTFAYRILILRSNSYRFSTVGFESDNFNSENEPYLKTIEKWSQWQMSKTVTKRNVMIWYLKRRMEDSKRMDRPLSAEKNTARLPQQASSGEKQVVWFPAKEGWLRVTDPSSLTAPEGRRHGTSALGRSLWGIKQPMAEL